MPRLPPGLKCKWKRLFVSLPTPTPRQIKVAAAIKKKKKKGKTHGAPRNQDTFPHCVQCRRVIHHLCDAQRCAAARFSDLFAWVWTPNPTPPHCWDFRCQPLSVVWVATRWPFPARSCLSLPVVVESAVPAGAGCRKSPVKCECCCLAGLFRCCPFWPGPHPHWHRVGPLPVASPGSTFLSARKKKTKRKKETHTHWRVQYEVPPVQCPSTHPAHHSASSSSLLSVSLSLSLSTLLSNLMSGRLVLEQWGMPA